MDFKEEISLTKQKIDKELAIFLDKRISEISKEDKWVAEGMEYIKSLILAGGKRIRPALLFWGYMSSGGRDEKKILKAAVGIELVHMFLLIHDDIIDRSDKRHGMETVNIWCEGRARRMFDKGDMRRFGYSMAMIFGDVLYAWAIRAIIESGLDTEKTVKAINYLQGIVSTTIVGESQDVMIEYTDDAKEEDIMRMCENKTAKYTVEGPLHLGAILAGAEDEILKSLSKYAIPVGIAFQIQDDILGIFGSEEKMGKSAASDIMEGKKTILTAKVFSGTNLFYKERLESILGKKDLKAEEINEFQEIIMDSGALKYAKEKSFKYAEKGKRAISKSSISSEGKEFLTGLADYIINREL